MLFADDLIQCETYKADIEKTGDMTRPCCVRTTPIFTATINRFTSGREAEYTYLGLIFDSTGGSKGDINNRAKPFGSIGYKKLGRKKSNNTANGYALLFVGVCHMNAVHITSLSYCNLQQSSPRKSSCQHLCMIDDAISKLSSVVYFGAFYGSK